MPYGTGFNPSGQQVGPSSSFSSFLPVSPYAQQGRPQTSLPYTPPPPPLGPPSSSRRVCVRVARVAHNSTAAAADADVPSLQRQRDPVAHSAATTPSATPTRTRAVAHELCATTAATEAAAAGSTDAFSAGATEWIRHSRHFWLAVPAAAFSRSRVRWFHLRIADVSSLVVHPVAAPLASIAHREPSATCARCGGCHGCLPCAQRRAPGPFSLAHSSLDASAGAPSSWSFAPCTLVRSDDDHAAEVSDPTAAYAPLRTSAAQRVDPADAHVRATICGRYCSQPKLLSALCPNRTYSSDIFTANRFLKFNRSILLSQKGRGGETLTLKFGAWNLARRKA